MQTNGRQGNQQGNQLIILPTVKGQLNIQYITISKCICMTFLFCVTYLSLLAKSANKFSIALYKFLHISSNCLTEFSLNQF